jgi:hypothetical protein
VKTFVSIGCIVLTACCAFAADAAKPKIKVADDGFPAGRDTPEGAACDLARAFIGHDVSLFMTTCVPLYAGGNGPEDYAKFLQSTVERMKQEALEAEPSPGGPKSIDKVFAARHLSRNGPASYGYASFNFQDVMFVDVGVLLHNGKRSLNRTLVIKDRGGKWYAHPLPTAGSGLLGDGLNDESPSEKDFSEAYEIEKFSELSRETKFPSPKQFVEAAHGFHPAEKLSELSYIFSAPELGNDDSIYGKTVFADKITEVTELFRTPDTCAYFLRAEPQTDYTRSYVGALILLGRDINENAWRIRTIERFFANGVSGWIECKVIHPPNDAKAAPPITFRITETDAGRHDLLDERVYTLAVGNGFRLKPVK